MFDISFKHRYYYVNGKMPKSLGSYHRYVGLFDEWPNKKVIKIDKYNFKVGETNNRLYRQTQCELNFYRKRLDPKDSKYFPTLIDHGKVIHPKYGEQIWLVQEYIELATTVLPSEKEAEIILYLKDKYQFYDVVIASNNSKMSNCGISVDGVPIIYDFSI